MSAEELVEEDNTASTASGLSLNPLDQQAISEAPDSQLHTVNQQRPGLSAERSLAENNVSKVKLCGVCNEKVSKYKCTRCYLPYCSIVCSTLHKVNHPANESPPPSKPEPIGIIQTGNTVPRLGTIAAAGYRGPFSALDDSKDLQTLFKLYPTLPSLLGEIHAATLQPTDEDGINVQPQYHRVKGQHRSNRKVWNLDRGLQDGVEALRRARRIVGKDGEAVKEYSRLILQILSRDDTVHAEALIQKEVADEDARIVSMLLNGET